jgi:hypothetical protein
VFTYEQKGSINAVAGSIQTPKLQQLLLPKHSFEEEQEKNPPLIFCCSDLFRVFPRLRIDFFIKCVLRFIYGCFYEQYGSINAVVGSIQTPKLQQLLLPKHSFEEEQEKNPPLIFCCSDLFRVFPRLRIDFFMIINNLMNF